MVFPPLLTPQVAPGCRAATQDHPHSACHTLSAGSTPRPLSRLAFPTSPSLPVARKSSPTAPAPAPLPGTYNSFQCLLNVRFTPRPLPGPADSFPASWIPLFPSLSRQHPYLATSGGSAGAAPPFHSPNSCILIPLAPFDRSKNRGLGSRLPVVTHPPWITFSSSQPFPYILAKRAVFFSLSKSSSGSPPPRSLLRLRGFVLPSGSLCIVSKFHRPHFPLVGLPH